MVASTMDIIFKCYAQGEASKSITNSAPRDRREKDPAATKHTHRTQKKKSEGARQKRKGEGRRIKRGANLGVLSKRCRALTG